MMNESDEAALASLVTQHGIGDVLAFLAKGCRNAIQANVRPMIDLSSSHLSPRDVIALSRTDNPPVRVSQHEYGWVVFITAEGLGEKGNQMRAYGYTRTFIAIYMAAASMDTAPILINFDRDGDTNPAFETFDW
jgi:hypothetical protein